jgi:hypothetical protein
MSSLLLALDLREIGRFTAHDLDRTAQKNQYIRRGQMPGNQVFPRLKKERRTRPEAMHGDTFLDLNAVDNHSPSPPPAAMSDNP